MTTEQILQECKKEVAEEFKQTVTIHTQYVKLWYAEKVANLYAQKIAELFAEWILTERVGLNREKGFCYPRESWDYYDHKGLYQIFLNQLNSTK